ncbi:histone-fold-containing protein [Daldinia vernicosa]|uniref:histone-fold-containing protein n=1 Tax=Daldinia vernicosa TaxID=114800 RepID=UPI0020081A20|nr:histone-fold-containing protein [Daldinia vernicosa]KAI0850536.1 histone-fold-containing protein [Daldinia vernicosa]
MPPRKTDNARQSNLSMAQFVYDGSDADVDTSSTSLRPILSVPARSKPVQPAQPQPTPSIEMDTQRPAEAASPTEKDKERKDSTSKDNVTIEDVTLPKSIIMRLAKGVLPPNTQIQANAILAMSKSATVFISHLANAANEHTQSSNKKTIMPADVFAALEDIEFPSFCETLEAEFKKFNETQTTKRNTYRRKVAAAKKAEKAGVDPNSSIMSTASTAAASQPDSAGPRALKKQKPNAPDDSAMDVDVGDEPREHSDAETEPEPEQEEDEEEEENEGGEEEEEEDEEDEEEEEKNDPDRLEDREPRDDHDDALDDGDSD